MNRPAPRDWSAFTLVTGVRGTRWIPAETHEIPLSAALLSEVNTLRNLSVKGNCYHSTLLVAPSPEVQVLYEVVDEEPGKSWEGWEQKFPLSKFNQPLTINCSNAQTAFV